MQITFFFENYEIGGGSKYVRDCINGALVRGDEVTLLSNQGALSTDDFMQLIRPVDLQSVRVFERTQSVSRLLGNSPLAAIVRKSLVVFTPILFLFNLIEIWRKLGGLKSELMIACNGGYPASESALAAVLAARLRKLPSVLIIMSTPKARRKILPGYDRLLDYFIFTAADIVVLNSVAQSRILVQLRGMPVERIRTLYNGIPNLLSQRKAQPLTRTHIILGVACRLDPMKGLDHLIRAIALLPERVSLRIVGDGESRETLQKLAQSEGISERVVFVGYKQDKDIVYELDTFDFYVFPSLWEGLPYSLLEAMRAGLPIISTNVGGIPEALGSGKAGLLVNPASPQALAEAINILLDDHEMATQLGAAARQRYEDLFSLCRMQESFAQIIAEVQLNNKQY